MLFQQYEDTSRNMLDNCALIGSLDNGTYPYCEYPSTVDFKLSTKIFLSLALEIASSMSPTTYPFSS